MTTSALERRAVAGAPRSLNESARTIEFLASSTVVDAYNSIVKQEWDLTRYRANPVVLLNHDTRQPIGTAKVRLAPEGLVAVVCFAEDDECAERAWNLAKQGVLRGCSVGFRSNDRRVEKHNGQEVLVLGQNELWELSLTAMPANQEALARSLSGNSMADTQPNPQGTSPAATSTPTAAQTAPTETHRELGAVLVSAPETISREAHDALVGALRGELDQRTTERDAARADARRLQGELDQRNASDLTTAVRGYAGRKFSPASEAKWQEAAKRMGREAFEALMADMPDIAMGERLVAEGQGETRSTDGEAADLEKFNRAVEAYTKQGKSKADAIEAALRDLHSPKGLSMAAVPPNFRHRGEKITHKFGTTSGVAIAKGQLVKYGATTSVVTGTTAADSELIIGIACEAVASADAGATTEIEVMFLMPGDIFPLINGSSCTAGTRVACEGNDGRVTDVGATPASGSVIGIALATTSTDGDLVPVLIAPH